MNLRQLKPSRHSPKVGDLFVLLPPDEYYRFGRVVSTNANPLGAGGGIVVYIYSVRSKERLAPSALSVRELLIPPVITNRLPWSKGYFEHMENRPIAAGDTLPVHCFARSWVTPVQYFDEHGERLSGPVEPVGEWGLNSFRTIDDKISKALGIAVSRDE